MLTVPSPSEPSQDVLLTEVMALRQRIAELAQEKQERQVMLEIATEHADDLSEALQLPRVARFCLSPTTYAATAAVLTITQTLTVAPKGVPAPITLYDVGGIGAAHQLFLPEQHEELRPALEA